MANIETKQESLCRPALELLGVSKSFGQNRANDDICLSVERGSIHGIIGENGAGKSTLMKIIYGMQHKDRGEIRIDGKNVSNLSSAEAISNGIGMVHQHFMLVPSFTVLENVMLGFEEGIFLHRGRTTARKQIVELSERYNLAVNPDALVHDLNVGQRQRVEIIKALREDTSLLILDEPTGVLTPQETEQLFEIIRNLRDAGVSILLITHKLPEIMAVTDNVSVMRQGRIVGHRVTADTSPEELAELMVGRKVVLDIEKSKAAPSEVRMTINKLHYRTNSGIDQLKDINFEVRAGEILGVAGVSGNGQTQLMELLAGMRNPTSGTIDILGTKVTAQSTINPRKARQLGLGHVPEDRHRHGLVLTFEIRDNLILGLETTKIAGEGLLIDPNQIQSNGIQQVADFDIRPPEPRLTAKNLSGGNQQKIVIAREVAASPRILLVGHPTRGVDVGAMEFIYKQLLELRDAGCAILLVSAELDEILTLSDRIMVLCGGKNMGVVKASDTDRSILGLMMAGQSPVGGSA